MPLAVENSWTYRWRSSFTNTPEEFKTDEKFCFYFLEFEYKKKTSFALGYQHHGRVHEETYTITRQDVDQFFFTVKSSPDVPVDYLRDGRYEQSVETAWSWWGPQTANDREFGLTESIKRDWSYPHNQVLLRGQDPEEGKYPSDDRILIHLKYWNGGWGNDVRTWHIIDMYDKRLVPIITYSSEEQEVSVPAGHFKQCLRTVLVAYMYSEDVPPEDISNYFDKHKDMLLFETQTYWAPGVGMVREYQKLGDGRLAYDLELLKYDVAGKKKE
jgi:hypothetical protein